MKNGMAMRVKESIPPNILVMTRDIGAPRASVTTIPEMHREKKMGKPKTMVSMRTEKARMI